MLINCVAYQNGRKLADIQVGEIHLYIHEPDCFVWVALADPDPTELEAMQREFGLHELAVEDARVGHQRPKIEEYGDSLFVVLQMIEPLDGDLNVGEVDIFVGQNYVLSVRNRAKRGFSDVRQRCERAVVRHQRQLPTAYVGLPANLIVGGGSEVLECQVAPRFQTQPC